MAWIDDILERDNHTTGAEMRVRSASVEPPPRRKVIHIDMDAFFASVEQRDTPELRGRPVAVGGSCERGVVAAASYEARRYGVHSAMASVTAKRKCPTLIFVLPRFDVYKAVSRQIRAIFADHTPIIEPVSLDEAYLDVTENLKGIASATEIAEDIRARIWAETGLTASAGVSYNKLLAKLASDHRKPDGLFVITPKLGPSFVETLSVEKFHGIGPATTAKLKRFGIETGHDLRAQTLAFLRHHFGTSGLYFYGLARGIDERPVRADRLRKSIGTETTFAQDLREFDRLRDALRPILDRLWRQYENTSLRGRTVTLKVKFSDFQQITRSRSMVSPVAGRVELGRVSLELLWALRPIPKPVRLLGISLSNFGPHTMTETQMRLPF